MSQVAGRARAIPTEQKDALFGSTGDDCRFISDRRPRRRRAGERAYHCRATRYRPSRNAHPEIRSGAGRRQPTHPLVRGRYRLSGSLLFPEQHPPDFLALRAEATMRFALRGQSAGRRVRLSGQALRAAGAPQPSCQSRRTGVLARGCRISALRLLANSLRQRSGMGNDAPAFWTCDGVGCVPRTISDGPRHLLKLSTRVPGDFLEQSSSAVSIGPRFDSTGNRLDQRQELPSAAPPRLRR